MTAKKTPPKNANYYSPNGWAMIRDVWIASMNKGQFPLAIVAVLLLVLFLKLPAEEITPLIRNIVQGFKEWSLVGWSFWGVTSILWFFTNKHLRRIHSKEMKRVSDEKTNLYNRLAGTKLPSSNGPSKQKK